MAYSLGAFLLDLFDSAVLKAVPVGQAEMLKKVGFLVFQGFDLFYLGHSLGMGV